MCNRYRATASERELARRMGLDTSDIDGERGKLPPPELFPKRPAWIVRKEGGNRVLDVMTWGIVNKMPGKRPGTTVTKHVTNVRNLSSPFWRGMLKSPAQRCLVPFTSFAEPRPGKDETGQPACWWFTVPSAEDGISCFAGIWRFSEGENRFAFLTCEPNPLVAPLHPKAMPVIVQPDDYDVWLDGDVDSACALAQPFPSQLMAVA